MSSGDTVMCILTPPSFGLEQAFKYMVPMINAGQWPLTGEEYVVFEELDEKHVSLLDIGFCQDGSRFCFRKDSFVKVDLSPIHRIIENH